jgi:Acyl-coenzyme A synthetases/AMP-(fatty) acid ligases
MVFLLNKIFSIFLPKMGNIILGKSMTQSALWQPNEKHIEQTNLHQFKQNLSDKYHVVLDDYADIYEFSISQPEKFWLTLWNDYSGQDSLPEDTNVLINKKAMPGAVWFPDVQLNYAQCLLRSRPREDNAIIFRAESQFERQLSYGQLYDLVSKTAQAMRAAGVKKGDRVAAMMPNMPETIIFMLAATSIGAIWASCSPDFGAKGVVDRFGQIEPVMLIAVNGYFYNGKTHSCIDKCQEIASQIDSIKNMIIVPYSATDNDNIAVINHATWMEDFIQPFAPMAIEFETVEFNHPLYIMFSSGTTGVPKCIVHGTGGTLLQHLKELVLHTDVKPNDHLFYFTTCGWMMWNWMVSGLACGAVLML